MKFSSSLAILSLLSGVGASSSTRIGDVGVKNAGLHRRGDLWGIIPRGGAEEAAAETEEPSLDERVMAAMNKLGISSSGAAATNDSSDGSCRDGVCTLPTEPTSTITEEEFRKEFEELDDSIVFAALSATRDMSSAENDTDEVKWNYDAARNLLQQELDAIQRITPDSPEVKQLQSEGFKNVSFIRRALAFAENNVEDARAILQAEEQDAQIEEEAAAAAQQKQKEEEEKRKQPPPQPSIAIDVPTNFDPAAAAAASAKPQKPAEVVFDVTASNFQELVLDSPVPVLLDVYADWCGPCKALTPALEEITQKAKGSFRLCKLNTDQERPISSNALKVQALPTVFAIRDGKIIDSFQGMPRDENTLRQFLMQMMDPSSKAKKDFSEQTVALYKLAGLASMPFAKRERLEMYIQDKICTSWFQKDPAHLEGGLELVKKLCSNVVSNPTDSKFKSWNLANKFFQKQGLTMDNSIFAKQLLPTLGFKDDGDSKMLYPSKNIGPLMVCQSSIEKWLSVHRREMAAEARKRRDEEARAQLEIEEEVYDEYDSDNEEEDNGMVQIRLRVQGKKKVHELNVPADIMSLSDLIKPFLKGNESKEYTIVCPSKKISISSADSESLSQPLKDSSLFTSTSKSATTLVLQFVTPKDEEKESSSSKLQERAAARRSKKKGSHTMQSVGIYAKDDNAKGELIDGGGGVWYEHDVSSDDEAEGEEDGKAEEANEDDEKNDKKVDESTEEELSEDS